MSNTFIRKILTLKDSENSQSLPGLFDYHLVAKWCQVTGLSDLISLKNLVFRDSNLLRCLSLSVKHLVGAVCLFYLPWLACNGVIYSCHSLNELVLPPNEKRDEMESIIPVRIKEAPDVTAHRLEALALLLQ